MHIVLRKNSNHTYKTEISLINTCSLNNNVITSTHNTAKDSSYQTKMKITFEFATEGIHFAHLNIQHLMPKIDELRYHLDQQNVPHIFGFSETFLNENVKDSELIVHNFIFERRDRGSKGGGIIVYISENIPYKRRFDL